METKVEAMDDDAIRALITRLARPHASGGEVIERAAILAEGADFAAVMAWIVAHAGEPEAAGSAGPGGGPHRTRLNDSGGGQPPPPPLRFPAPAGAPGRRRSA